MAFEWFRKKKTEPKAPVTSKAEQKKSQAGEVYDAVNQMMNNVILFYERGNRIDEEHGGIAGYDPNVLDVVRRAHQLWMNRLLAQMNLTSAENPEFEAISNAFTALDMSTIREIPQHAAEIIAQMMADLPDLKAAVGVESADARALQQLYDEAFKGALRANQAVTEMVASGAAKGF